MLTKEKSNQKRKGVNNQNNSSFLFELFPFINTIFTSSLSFKDSIKEKKLWSKEWVVPQYDTLKTINFYYMKRFSRTIPEISGFN
jgi:hypothetical protein